MKSKTFCFNRTIFKKNVTHYWPIWTLYLVYLLLLLPGGVWQRTSNVDWYYSGMDKTSRMYSIVNSIVQIQITPGPVFIVAAVAALAVFSYLYTAKNANMIHALPVNRLELYVTNCLSGLAFLIVPEIIAFLMTVLVCLMNDITCIQYLFFGLLAQMGMTFFAFMLAVFVAMFTGQIFAMPFYYLVVNYLYVGCLFLVNQIIVLINYGIDDAWDPGKACVLSPLYYLGNNVWNTVIRKQNTDVITGIEIHGMPLIGLYAAVAVVIAVTGYQLYKRRQIETAGDWIAVGRVKPVFRWGVALCGGVGIGIIFSVLLNDSQKMNMYACMMVFTLLGCSVCFFVAEMLLQKNFRVFRKKRLIEWAGVMAVAACFLTLFEVDAFGMERRIPKEDEIEAAFVFMDYPVLVDEEELPRLLELHAEAIENKEEYLKAEKEGKGYYYTSIRYFLKDGTELERRYPLAISEEDLDDETTPFGQILAWERETERFKDEILGCYHEDNIYITGSIDLYDDEGNYRDYVLDRDQIEVIAAAVERDIDEGNMDAYCLPSMSVEGQESYYNNINLDYSNSTFFHDSWEYYDNYRQYAGKEESRESVTSRNIYLSFGPECTNLIEALEQLGVTDDTWKLCTYEEYEKLGS